MSQRGRGGIPRFFVCQTLWVGVGGGEGVADSCNPRSIPAHAGFSFSKVRQKKKKKKELKSLVKRLAGSRCDSKFVNPDAKHWLRNQRDERDRPFYFYLQTGAEEPGVCATQLPRCRQGVLQGALCRRVPATAPQQSGAI